MYSFQSLQVIANMIHKNNYWKSSIVNSKTQSKTSKFQFNKDKIITFYFWQRLTLLKSLVTEKGSQTFSNRVSRAAVVWPFSNACLVAFWKRLTLRFNILLSFNWAQICLTHTYPNKKESFYKRHKNILLLLSMYWTNFFFILYNSYLTSIPFLALKSRKCYNVLIFFLAIS